MQWLETWTTYVRKLVSSMKHPVFQVVHLQDMCEEYKEWPKVLEYGCSTFSSNL